MIQRWLKKEKATTPSLSVDEKPVATANNTEKPDPNPYLDERRGWNSQVDRAFSEKHVWQLFGVAGMLIGVTAVAGMAYIGSKSKFVPYVIEVNKLGEAVTVGPAQVATTADPRVVRASLASFISSARMVTPDVTLQREAIFRAYAMLRTKDPAATAINDWYNGTKDSSPFVRASKVTVTTDINSVLAISQNAWQVDWQETTRDRDGAMVGQPVHMRAVLTVYLDPPSTNTNEASIQRNPLGIYISNYNWQEVM